MDTKQLEAFAKEAAKSIKSESDLNDFRQMLSKVAIETAFELLDTSATSFEFKLVCINSPNTQ